MIRIALGEAWYYTGTVGMFLINNSYLYSIGIASERVVLKTALDDRQHHHKQNHTKMTKYILMPTNNIDVKVKNQ